MKRFLYLIRSRDIKGARRGKFGCTDNPPARMNGYKTYYPSEIELIRLWRIVKAPDAHVSIGLKDPDLVLQYICGRGSIHHVSEGGGTEWYDFADDKYDVVRELYEGEGYVLEDVTNVSLPPTNLCETPPTEPRGFPALRDLYLGRARAPSTGGTMRPVQQEAFDCIMDQVRSADGELVKGILELSVGVGKTMIGVNLHCALELNTLWITYRNDIVNSQCKDFELFGRDNYLLCNEGRFDPVKAANFLREGAGRVVVVLRQSLDKAEDLDKIIRHVGCLIVDEAHECTGPMIRKVLDKVMLSPQLRLAVGMTGTPFTESDEQRRAMVQIWGNGTEITHLYRPYNMFDAYADNLLVEPNIVIKHCDANAMAVMSGADCSEECLKTFARQILADTMYYGAPYYKQIVRVGSIEICERLFKAFLSIDKPPEYGIYMAHSGRTEQRDEKDKVISPAIPAPPRTYLKEFDQRENYAIILTCEMLETGYNNPRITMVALAKGTRDYPSHRMIQSWGRCLRKHGTKERGTLLLYVAAVDVDYVAYKFVHQLYGHMDLENSTPNAHSGRRGVCCVLDAKRRVIMTIQICDGALTYSAEDIRRAVERAKTKHEVETSPTYANTRRYVRTLAILTPAEYREWALTDTHLPDDPARQFRQEWGGWPDFLGIDTAERYTLVEALHRVGELVDGLPLEERLRLGAESLVNIQSALDLFSQMDPKLPPMEWAGHWEDWFGDIRVISRIRELLLHD